MDDPLIDLRTLCQTYFFFSPSLGYNEICVILTTSGHGIEQVNVVRQPPPYFMATRFSCEKESVPYTTFMSFLSAPESYHSTLYLTCRLSISESTIVLGFFFFF